MAEKTQKRDNSDFARFRKCRWSNGWLVGWLVGAPNVSLRRTTDWYRLHMCTTDWYRLHMCTKDWYSTMRVLWYTTDWYHEGTLAHKELY